MNEEEYAKANPEYERYKKYFEETKKQFPNAQLSKIKRGGFAVETETRSQYLMDLLNQDEEEVSKIMILFEEWFLNRRLMLEQKEIAKGIHKAREDVNRSVRKYEQLFEFIELCCLEHAICSGIFRIFKLEGEEADKNKLKQALNTGNLEEVSE